VLADSGYTNTDALATLDEQDVEAYVAVSRDESHTQRQYEFRPETKASKKKITHPRLLDIKHVLGFRQFLHRGLAKVSGEWERVCLAYNVKRLFRLHSA